MICKILLGLYAISCIVCSLQAASLPGLNKNSKTLVEKLDYEGVETNVRNARQAYPEDEADDDSDEDDEEDDAELQHQSAVRRQQIFEQAIYDSQEGSDEDNFEEDVDDYNGRRAKRDVLQTVDDNNKIEETVKPSNGADNNNNNNKQPATETTSTTVSTPPSNTDFSNTSVLILIRDVIKKVTELPNTQQVATSAQQYFQLFEHFLQQTIKQVIGEEDDDDDDDNEEKEVESTTLLPEADNEIVNETPAQTQPSENSNKPLESDTGDKHNNIDIKVPQVENISAEINKIKS